MAIFGLLPFKYSHVLLQTFDQPFKAFHLLLQRPEWPEWLA